MKAKDKPVAPLTRYEVGIALAILNGPRTPDFARILTNIPPSVLKRLARKRVAVCENKKWRVTKAGQEMLYAALLELKEETKNDA